MRAWIAAFFLLASCSHIPARVPSSNGPDGAAFEKVDLSVYDKCNQTVMAGTERFKGTAFVMPQVYLSENETGYPIIQVLPPAPGGNYVLRMALRFPRSPSEVNMRVGENSAPYTTCDMSMLQERLNDSPYVKRTGVPLSLAPLSLNMITIGLADFNGKLFTYGNKSTDILDTNTNILVQYELTPAEYTDFERRIKSEAGIAINVDYYFTARSTTAFFKADLEHLNIASGIEAQLKAKASPAGLVSEAEVSAALSNLVTSQKADIYIEGGKPLDSDGIGQVVTKLLNDAISAASVQPPASANQTADANPGAPTIKLDAMLKYFREKKSTSINLKSMGDPSQHVFSSASMIRSDFFGNSDISFSEIISGVINPKIVVTQTKAGQTFGVAPVKVIVDDLTYVPVKHYLSKEEIEVLGESFWSEWPLLSNGTERVLVDFNSLGRRRAYMPLAPVRIVKPSWSANFYMWGRIDYQERTAKESFEWNSPEKLRTFPVAAFFAKLGERRFTISDLIDSEKKYSQYWTASVDSVGTLLITPQQDLGAFYLISSAEVPSHRGFKLRHFQEKWGAPKTVIGKSVVKETTYSTADTETDLPDQRQTAVVKIISSPVTDFRIAPTAKDSAVQVQITQ